MGSPWGSFIPSVQLPAEPSGSLGSLAYKAARYWRGGRLPLDFASPEAQVCSINSRFAKVHILYVGSTPLKSTFRGTIRREDIRATEKDKVEVYKSFRPGDIVLAKVISLGDAQSNYLLSTAENELGVVVARSEAGVQMVPISWCEMQCPRTHTKDFRKVARVQPQFLQT
ncbi:exosome complex component CSL4 isoform X6 [Aquila chrysaetos chrysaetos]|uniref:exosome complex component CSL4 isoform X6 n=1 Tax=Aquila chrysaetos chrysaetos TaxID=223781 RepID=UPI0005D05AE8|nr:exosome complex component CSL4 isoform X6 [Aquila chrysaetos chrysaetos]